MVAKEPPGDEPRGLGGKGFGVLVEGFVGALDLALGLTLWRRLGRVSKLFAGLLGLLRKSLKP